jgi:hypothetical protein
MQRPTGVTILAVAMFLGIPYLLAAALFLVGGGAFLGGIPIVLMNSISLFVDWPVHALMVFFLQFRIATNPAVLVVFYCILVLLYLTVGVGLLRLRNWARFAGIVLAILNLGVAMIGYAGPRMLLFRQSIISMVIEVAILIYLFRPKVREAFGAMRIRSSE